MNSNASIVLLLALALSSPQAAAEPEESAAPQSIADATTEQPEVIVITGRWPGPPLWKVSNGDNVLWIFGMLDRVPLDMEWDTARVERVIKESTAYLPSPNRGVRVVGWGDAIRLLNPVTLVRGINLGKRLSRDPEGKRLQETLSPELYQRFSVLKSRYFPKDKDIERKRPLIAMGELSEPVMKQSGLGTSERIRRKVLKLLGKNRKMQRFDTSAVIELNMSFREIAERAEHLMETIPRDRELACFEQELSRMEVDLEAIKRRANAWALGNIDEFRDIALQIPDENPCVAMIAASSEGATATDLEAQARTKWLTAATTVLTDHRVGFAMLSIPELLSEQGLLSQLRELGYDVKEP